MSAAIFFFGGFGLGHLPLNRLYGLLEHDGRRIVRLPFPEGGGSPEEAVQRLVRRTGIRREDTVAGWSLGGQLAALAAEHSGCRLITLASNPHFCAAPQYPFGMPAAEFAAFRRRQTQDPTGNLKRFARLIARKRHAPQTARTADAPPPDTTVAQQEHLHHLDWLAALDTFPVLHRLTAAQLHILGREDILFDSAALAAVLPHHTAARTVVLDGAGHLLPFDHADTVAALIRGFLTSDPAS